MRMFEDTEVKTTTEPLTSPVFRGKKWRNVTRQEAGVSSSLSIGLMISCLLCSIYMIVTMFMSHQYAIGVSTDSHIKKHFSQQQNNWKPFFSQLFQATHLEFARNYLKISEVTMKI